MLQFACVDMTTEDINSAYIWLQNKNIYMKLLIDNTKKRTNFR